MRPALLTALVAIGGLALLLRPPTDGNKPPAASTRATRIPETQTTEITPESLAAEVESLRELQFVRPLIFIRVPAAGLEQRIREAMTAAVPPAEAALRVRAALALGMIRPGMEFDTADCLTGSAMEVPAAHYDDATATLWVNDTFAPATRPDLTLRLVFHLARALVIQRSGRAAWRASSSVVVRRR